MTDFSSLQQKVDALKAMVASNSITPKYLGAILDDFITQMKAIDMTGMSDDVATALQKATTALSQSASALEKSGDALTASSSALQNALSAIEKANNAIVAATDAKTTASAANKTATEAKSMASNAQGNANGAIRLAEQAVKDAKAAGVRTISIDDLDTMGTDGSGTDLLNFLNDLATEGPQHTRYAVMETANGASRLVGTLDMFSDNMHHVITQVLETHNSFEDGQIVKGTHICEKLYRYYRSYNLSAPDRFGVERGQWSPWTECEPESLDALRKSVSTMNTNLSKQISAVSLALNTAMFTVKGHAYINANALMGVSRSIQFVDFTDWVKTNVTYISNLLPFGTIVRFISVDGWKEMRYIGANAGKDFQESSSWEELDSAGGSATGNVINIHEITNDWNATNRGEAAAKVPEKLRTGGRKITFMSAPGKWQSWQFTGALALDWSKEEFWRQEVRSVSINGAPSPDPDRDGNVDLSFEVPIDQTLNGESQRAVSNSAVVAGLAEVEGQIPAKHSFDAATRMLNVMDKDGNILESINIPGGGGSGDTNPTAIEIIVQSALQTTVKEGDACTVEYLWRHYNINNNVDTQYGGTAELLVGGAVVDRKMVTQGFNSFNVGPWLQSGLNTVRIRLTADDGLVSQSAAIRITAAALSLRSLYDISTANPVGSSAQVRYIVNGSGDKEVSFEMDSITSVETIKTSGATSIKTLGTSAFYHSVHTLTMQARRDLGNGNMLETDPVVFDMMFVSRDSYKPLIALQRPQTAPQYSTIEIPFAVYDPENAQSAIVEIYLGDTLVERQRVDRSLHTFSYRVRQYGPQTFTFKVQNSHLSTENEITVDVLQASTQIEAETDGLSLYLSALGRSNDADNRDDWSYTSEQGWYTAAQFQDVKFDAQSGWRKDKNGITALHLEKGATCFIPFKPFSTDAKQSGKTIEIEFSVSNCFDTTASLISCMMGNVGFDIKAQEAAISSALLKTVGTKFKQDERIRIGFVIEPVAGTNRFMHLFVKGKHSGVVQYDTNDYFVQNPAQGITMGNASCELDIYNIRIYEQALSFRQMLNNSIADMDDTRQMFAKLEANDIFNDESGLDEISYEKAVKKIACLTYIGELPKFKGDKKIGWLVYEDPEHSEDNFRVLVQIDVQGTSSQYYVVKNYKAKFKDLLQMANGTTAKKFALRCVDALGNPIPQKAVKTFCFKADFAESSGTHNTGAANMIDEILKAAGILTPMQEKDSTVRTTIYGHPCLMFHQETESSPKRFVGKYNFNNDKSTNDTFGFQDIEGFNAGMINRDDYLVWDGRLSELQGNADALAAAEDADATYYLIENAADSLNNHLVEYDDTAGAWVDKGEMWRWKAHLLAWGKNDGSTCTRAQGILDKVKAGELVENNVECWEFLNNGHPMCLFHSSDYTTQVSQGLGSWIKEAWLNKTDAQGKKVGPYWSGAFEPRYPDNDDNNIRYARGKVPEQLKRVTDWLASLAINDEKLTEAEKQAKTQLFTGQISSYFNKRMALAYDLIRQGFVAADQGAKNMMWAIIDGIIYIIFYDNDTIWLINNEGRIMFIPYVENHSKDELGKYVFNGESSTLWNHIERGLQSEQRQLYADMVAAGFTYERALYWFNERQSDKWCEAVKNADSKYKYIDSFGNLSEDGSGQTNNYLDMAQGDREEHRKWAMYERFQYQNAKWGAGSFRESRIYLRANTAGESSVPAKVAVDLTAAQDWYFAFRFSANDGWNPQRIEEGKTVHFEAPAGSMPNDTETYIHQADRLSDIGDISTLYPTTCDIAQGRMLRQLVVGNKTAGYRGKLAELTFGTHPLLKYINVVNLQTLAKPLDVSGCTALEEIEAQGSAITGVNLAAGCNISKMHLPETLVQLRLADLPMLSSEGLVLDGVGNIHMVDITNCPNLNPMDILEQITQEPGNSLQYVRISGAKMQGSGEELNRLLELGVHGVTDQLGKPEINGTYELTSIIDPTDIEAYEQSFEGLDMVLAVEAVIKEIDAVNGESAGVDTDANVELPVTIDNVIDHVRYFNGETYAEWLARFAAENY
ncbi:hypothetical protein [uncultured Duncaniella sp.]|uniref:hypothetical protein n=1 Tax=uncultured Duncaniella sp. TaxID=2768039 RepID=UPI0025B6B6B7|nr:hypothetical protein [uncultured Duncaniella sp.]